MKRIFTHTMILITAIIISLGFATKDEEGKVHLKINKEENGKKTVFEKSYASMDALKADQELMEFDILVKDWAIDHADGFIVKKSTDAGNSFSWTVEEGEENSEGPHHIVIKKKSGGKEKAENVEKIIKVKTDGDGKVYTIKIEGDGEHNMAFINANGEKTEFSKDKIETMIQSHADGAGEHIHKKMEVIVTEEGDGEEKILIQHLDDKEKVEVTAEIQKEIGEDGEEKIIDKKVWIMKDGKKIELDGEDDFQFETEGDNITIKMDKKTIDLQKLSDKDGMVIVKKFKKGDDGDKGSQTMNINIEEKNGEKYIEIDINRTSEFNVSISDILEGDASLKEVDFSLKNNLKPSELKFYPNPNNGRFNLHFKLEQEKEVTVKVMDILGNEVYKERIIDFSGSYDNQIDLTGKEKGIYILQIVQKKKALSQKILIE